MNNLKRKIAALITAAIILCSFGPTVFAEEGQTDSFYLVACTEYDIIIEPVAVSYAAGQSIKDALIASGYSFGGLEERNYI